MTDLAKTLVKKIASRRRLRQKHQNLMSGFPGITYAKQTTNRHKDKRKSINRNREITERPQTNLEVDTDCFHAEV